MIAETFNAILERRQMLTRQTLIEKAKEYASDEDRLHNFKPTKLSNDCPEKVLWGYLVKHLVAIKDQIERVNNAKVYRIHTMPDWIDEKIGDAINYLHLLEGLMKDYGD